MEFRSQPSPDACAAYVAEAIRSRLEQGLRVLWLLSGGSAVGVAATAAELLRDVPLTNLVVGLADERFGPPGHADSNWQKLIEAGFDLPGAALHPVLTGKSQAQTASDFAAWLETQLLAAQYRIGLVGIGPDGHTSGILPHSPAVEAPGLACAYDGGQFQRITTTPVALRRLDEAVALVVGTEKWPALARLQTNITISDQPAQILKGVPRFVVFTDYKGGAT